MSGCYPNRLMLLLAVVFLVGCGRGAVPSHRTAAIAVWDLENLSPSALSQPDLGEVLAAEIIETIKSDGNHLVVERQRLVLALAELNLGTTALVHDDTKLRIGEMAGAEFMVFGAYQRIGDLMRLDIRLVSVETGKIHAAVQRTVRGTDLSAWLQATEKATLDLIP